jgi:hypothetical protein
MTSKWWVPLSGIVFIALLAAGMLIGGEPQGAEGISAQELTKFWVDHGDRFDKPLALLSLSLIALVYFGSYLKTALDTGAGETGCVSRVAFAGAIVFVVGAATDLTLVFAIKQAAGKIDPVALQALAAYWDNDWVPFALGVELLMSATAISAIRHGGIPKWLGWLAALIAIVGVVPGIGFFAMPATGVWIIIASIVLAIQARKVDAGPPAM